MNNYNGNNLRTHYSLLRKNKKIPTEYNQLDNNIYSNNQHSNINYNNYITSYQNQNRTPNKFILTKSYYNPDNYHYAKNNININVSEKEKLNKSFNKINPYYFQDKIQSIEKDNINTKIKNRIYLQREAIRNLSLHKIKNPSQKEKLQKLNEYSTNPLVSYNTKTPLQQKTLKNYYYNENIIKSNNLNIYNKPRKEIEDYYNKCQYNPQVTMNMDPVIHTKPNFIYPEYEKNRIGNEIKVELNKQLGLKNKNRNKNKRNNYSAKSNGVIEKEVNIDYELYLKTKEMEDKKDKQKEMLIDNDILNDYKQYQKKHLHDGEKNYFERMRKKMKEEDLQKKNEEKEEKLKTIKNLREWYDINQKINEKKENDKNKEKVIWRNYSEIYEVKCRHGNELYKCCRCGRNYSRDQVHKVYY